MRRVLAASVLLLAAAGCGSGGDSEVSGPLPELRRAAAGLASVESAHLDLAMTVRAGSGRPLGFRVRGPVQLGDDLQADVVWTSEGQNEQLRVIATRGRVWVERKGVAYELPDDRARSLTTTAGEGRDVRIDRWLRRPRSAEGGRVDGVDTIRVDADVHVETLLRDLAGLGRALAPGSPLAALGDRDIGLLARATRRAEASVWNGRADGVPRRVRLHVTLGDPGSAHMPAGLAALLPVTGELELHLTRVGQPVSVTPPAVPGR